MIGGMQLINIVVGSQFFLIVGTNFFIVYYYDGNNLQQQRGCNMQYAL
jgi:hypothetical protein